MTTEKKSLPPGQSVHPSFERFGLGLFAKRFPAKPDLIEFTIGGDVAQSVTVGGNWSALPRVEQVSDFHCVTTWSVQSLRWGGVRFADFYRAVVVPQARPADGAHFVVLRGQDGFRVSMQLEDLLAPDVMLADTLDGQPLGIAHGAPLRLVAPAHYGYKNLKHLAAIEFRRARGDYRFPFPYPDLMDHPRGRVALEERARLLPPWIIRPFYRALIPLARYQMRKGLEAYQARKSG
jgi:DMSO/TMAO reductase YedYZ molybdopterin-dependent catalytic subunit